MLAYVALVLACIGVLVAFATLLMFVQDAKLGRDQLAVVKELAYLNEVTEVAWYRVEGTTVKLAFRRPPHGITWERVASGAAWRAYRATGRRWRVIAVDMRAVGADGQPRVLGSVPGVPQRIIDARHRHR